MSAARAELPFPISEIALPQRERARREDVIIPFPPQGKKEALPSKRRIRLKPEVITESITRLDPAESIVQESTEVLENLWRVGMQEPEAQAGVALVDAVRHNPRINTLAFLGPPGVGKSTAIEQFVEKLFAEAGEEISVKITSFDPAFQRMIKYLPRELWQKVHWEFINNSLILSAKDKTRRPRSRKRRLYPAREVEIIEVPFVGRKATSDRGRTFVERRWQGAVEAHEEGSMLFVPFAPVSITVKKSMNFREEIALAESIPEQVAVLAKYGIEIASETLMKAGKKAYEILQEMIKQILQSANKKQQAMVAKDVQNAMREEMPVLPFTFLEEHIGLPRDLELSHDEAYNLRRYVFYWEMTLDEMGVPSHQRHIMINPPLARLHRPYLKKTV